MGLLNRLLGRDAAPPPLPISYIEKLDLRPGDILAVQLDGPITAEMADRLKGMIADVMPEGVKTLVTERHCRLTIVRAPVPPARNA